MNINGQHYTTAWTEPDASSFKVIDQRALPHELKILEIATVDEAAHAIKDMAVRGAPCIGITAAYGMWIAALQADDENFDAAMQAAAKQLNATRPTAVNLAWAIDRVLAQLAVLAHPADKRRQALLTANQIREEDIEICRSIGVHLLPVIEAISLRKNRQPVNILTHCNAGWLATSDWGTATSPMYQAHDAGIPVHIWVDETRPRNQGAHLTAFELGQHGVPHTLIVDNTGGHLMQHGMVDLVIVGTDRTTRTGDVANKIGTYLKALAAHDNQVPFYVALPSSTIDWSISDGLREIPIEQRAQDEVLQVRGLVGRQQVAAQIAPDNTPAANYGFDVTPARLVSGLVTERGLCNASEEGLLTLFPEQA